MSTAFTPAKDQSFTLPSYKFGNHRANCDCPTCSRIITSLRKRSYVQKLESLASQLHGEWQQAMGAGLSITQDLHAEGKELVWVEDNLTSICSVADKRAVLLETMTAERDALKTELAGYAAELKTITNEANIQREAADQSKAALKLADESIKNFQKREKAAVAAMEAAQEIIDDQKQSLELYQVHSVGARFLYGLTILVAAALGLGAGIVSGRFGR